MISYGLSLGGYEVYIQFSIAQLWTPGSIVHCLFSVNIYKSTKLKILSIICIRSIFSGRPSRGCSIQQAWLSVVGSTGGGVGFLRTAVLSWKVGGGSAGAQSPTCECYKLIISENVY
jgi:hypothetical protein